MIFSMRDRIDTYGTYMGMAYTHIAGAGELESQRVEESESHRATEPESRRAGELESRRAADYYIFLVGIYNLNINSRKSSFFVFRM